MLAGASKKQPSSSWWCDASASFGNKPVPRPGAEGRDPFTAVWLEGKAPSALSLTGAEKNKI